jgi:hypothetical protein
MHCLHHFEAVIENDGWWQVAAPLVSVNPLVHNGPSVGLELLPNREL